MRIHAFPIAQLVAVSLAGAVVAREAPDTAAPAIRATADTARIMDTEVVSQATPAVDDATDSTTAQQLTLDQCLQLAYDHNLAFRGERAGLEVNREQLRRAQAPFALNAVAGLILPSYSEDRNTFEDAALLARFREERTRFNYQGDVRLSQRVKNLGEFSVVGSGFRTDFISTRRQDFLEYGGAVTVGYEQEIFTEPEAELQLRQAELSLASDQFNFENRRVQLETEVTFVYYDLLQAMRQYEILEQRLEQSGSALELAQRKFEIGLIAEVQALRLQVDRLQAEAEHAVAATAIEAQRDQLRRVVGLDMSTAVQISSEVSYEVVPLDVDTAVRVGLERRTEMETAEIRRRLGEIDLQITRQSIGPSARLNAQVTLTGRGSDPGDISTSLERSRLTAEVNVNLPLVDGGQRHAALRQAEINLELTQLGVEQVRQQLIVEIRQAARAVRDAEGQIGLREAALEVAERTYSVEQSRFELGLADSQQLLEAQGGLTIARTGALDAVVNYLRALQAIRQATMSSVNELVANPG